MILRINNYITAILFVIILLVFFFSNLNTLKKTINEYNEYRNISLYLKSFDGIYKKNMNHREKIIDLYGILLKIINKKIVLNFEMIKTDGFVVFSEKNIKIDNESISKINNKLLTISNIAQEHKIPFIYIQPPYAYNKVTPEVAALLKMKEHIVFNSIQKILLKNNINYVDIYNILKNKNISKEQIFYKTDGHNSTYTEWETAKLIIDYMEDIGIRYDYDDVSKVFNKNNYQIIPRDFYGNAIRAVGDYYTKRDVYEIFIPNYYTKLELYVGDKKMREGTFKEVVMNGYETMNNKRLYYITNYGQYSESVYTYKNLNINNGHNILYICDSFSLRTIAMLTLLNKNVTVFDPRFNKIDDLFVKILAKNKYDAILFSAGTVGIMYGKF